MADAAREHIMLELVSKQDLLQETGVLRGEIERLRREMNSANAALRQDMDNANGALRQDMDSANAALRQDMNSANAALRQEMRELGLRLTVRLGALLGAGIALLAALERLG